MLPTPSTSHVDVNRIYEPAEDSFLLLDTLSSPTEIQFLTTRFSPAQNAGEDKISRASPLLVEVGTGSGVVLAFATAHAKRIFGRADILAIGTDINPSSCQASRQTVRKACEEAGKEDLTTTDGRSFGFPLAMLNADLTASLRPGAVDVLIFNPPYVPSPSVPIFQNREIASTDASRSRFEADSHLLSLSYEGGINGMEVTNRLLEQLPHMLDSERGVAYVLLCQQNKPQEVVQSIRGWGPEWSVEVVGRSGKQAGWEKLCVIRISRA